MKKWIFVLVGLIVVLGAVSIFLVYFQGSLSGAGAIPVSAWYFSVEDSDYLVITYPSHMSGKLLVFNKAFSPIIKLCEPKISESEILNIANEYLTASEEIINYWLVSDYGYTDKNMLGVAEPKIIYDKNDGCFWRLWVLYGNKTIGRIAFDAKTGKFMFMGPGFVYDLITEEQAKSILRDEGIKDAPNGYYVSLIMADIRGYVNE